MIAGASSADAAVLVVDAGVGEFETGFTGGGQTREHALLLKSLGIRQLIVAVNKMDKCGWDKVRFDEIVAAMQVFLSSAGYNDTVFVPVSGLVGHNLCCGPPAEGNWYSGPQLVEALDRLSPPPRDDDKALRLSVTSVHRSSGCDSAAVEGRIEQGRLNRDRLLVCMPAGKLKSVFLFSLSYSLAGQMLVVKSIICGSRNVSAASAGDLVYMHVVASKGYDCSTISEGKLQYFKQPMPFCYLFLYVTCRRQRAFP
jgi:elongation factor 1 alpha-like protein